MMASILALRLMSFAVRYSPFALRFCPFLPGASAHSNWLSVSVYSLLPPQANSEKRALPPIILHRRAFRHQRVEIGVLLEHDLAEYVVLARQYRLQTNQLQDRQKRAHQR